MKAIKKKEETLCLESDGVGEEDDDVRVPSLPKRYGFESRGIEDVWVSRSDDGVQLGKFCEIIKL